MKKINDEITRYWEERYNSGGNSGDGSYGDMANYKAKIINNYIDKYNIETISDFGCGDGNQISLLEGFEQYFGFDISKCIINKCRQHFQNKPKMSFYTDISRMPCSDLTLSIDVLYHIIDEKEFEKHLFSLFSKSNKYVLIFSSNATEREQRQFYILHRKFTDWIDKYHSNFELVENLKNNFKSSAEFFLYQKKKQNEK